MKRNNKFKAIKWMCKCSDRSGNCWSRNVGFLHVLLIICRADINIIAKLMITDVKYRGCPKFIARWVHIYLSSIDCYSGKNDGLPQSILKCYTCIHQSIFIIEYTLIYVCYMYIKLHNLKIKKFYLKNQKILFRTLKFPRDVPWAWPSQTSELRTCWLKQAREPLADA